MVLKSRQKPSTGTNTKKLISAPKGGAHDIEKHLLEPFGSHLGAQMGPEEDPKQS